MTTTLSTTSLREKWEALKAENPKLRIRNVAQELGVGEAQLVALNIGNGVTRLRPELAEIFSSIEEMGKVMALTRNDSVVHERKGVYLNGKLNSPHVGLFVGEDIDLRIFFGCYKFVFAVTEGEADKARHSLQFFDKEGVAVHKIYMTEDSNLEAYHKTVEAFKAEDQSEELELENLPAPDAEKPDSEIDVEGFQDAWKALKDTHHYFGLLKKFGLTRPQAMRLAPENYAHKLEASALKTVLESASEQELPIMCFVGNRGMIQIHTGPVKKLVQYGPWYNVLDPDFNLHIKESDISETWLVRKPSEDGIVTSLEFYNAEGEQIMQLFGKRKPGIPEDLNWRKTAEALLR